MSVVVLAQEAPNLMWTWAVIVVGALFIVATALLLRRNASDISASASP